MKTTDIDPFPPNNEGREWGAGADVVGRTAAKGWGRGGSSFSLLSPSRLPPPLLPSQAPTAHVHATPVLHPPHHPHSTCIHADPSTNHQQSKQASQRTHRPCRRWPWGSTRGLWRTRAGTSTRGRPGRPCPVRHDAFGVLKCGGNGIGFGKECRMGGRGGGREGA